MLGASNAITTMSRTYIKKEKIGRGGFAEWYKFKNIETGNVVAGKVIDKKTLRKSRTMTKLLYEISIHNSLDHPNIVKFLDFFEDDKNVYIMLEFWGGGNLNDHFKTKRTLEEKVVRNYLRQLISGLKYCHENNIIHRDLKLGNLLLSEDKKVIKLADFGLSSRLEYPKQRRRTICGTPNYIAPEIIGAKTTHSYEVDVWSLGVIMFILLTGNPPFMAKNIKETYKKIRQGDFKFPRSANLSDECKSLINVMLEKDSSKRASLEDLNEHPFVTCNGRIEPPFSISHERELELESEELKYSHYNDSESIINAPTINPEKKANLNHTLESASKNKNRPAIIGDINFDDIPKIWVVKAIDYSSKYGLGYLLSNGQYGAFFNDGTRLLMNNKYTRGTYYFYDEEDKKWSTKIQTNSIPEAYAKKMRIMDNFK